jgi:hypothetical protein
MLFTRPAGQPTPGATTEKWVRRIVDDFLEAALDP